MSQHLPWFKCVNKLYGNLMENKWIVYIFYFQFTSEFKLIWSDWKLGILSRNRRGRELHYKCCGFLAKVESSTTFNVPVNFWKNFVQVFWFFGTYANFDIVKPHQMHPCCSPALLLHNSDICLCYLSHCNYQSTVLPITITMSHYNRCFHSLCFLNYIVFLWIYIWQFDTFLLSIRISTTRSQKVPNP